MYDDFESIFLYDEQPIEATSTDALSDEIENSVKMGIIKGFEEINNRYATSGDAENVEFYTVASPSSADLQTVCILADIRNITIIGFLSILAVIIFYHLKGTIISFLS